jgi:hypothetical protein
MPLQQFKPNRALYALGCPAGRSRPPTPRGSQSCGLRAHQGGPHPLVACRLLWCAVEGGVQPFNHLFRCQENSSVPALSQQGLTRVDFVAAHPRRSFGGNQGQPGVAVWSVENIFCVLQ